jgi:hypothetical protein
MRAAILQAAALLTFLTISQFDGSSERVSAESIESAVSCTPQRPAVFDSETIQVRVWLPATNAQDQYTWTATGGSITGQDSTASWDFTGVKPGPYTASVKIRGGEHSVACSVRVIALEQADGRGVFTRVTGRQILVPGAAEAPGYGLYSYILFGSPPNETSRDRYLKAIQAYLELIPDLVALEKYAKPIDLNATYVPVAVEPPSSVSAEWVLKHYDYARAAIRLRVLPGAHADGPYIVSSQKPLTGNDSLTKDSLLQDLSAVPPDLVANWVKLFINQASQPNFWKPQSATTTALRLRTAVVILSMVLPDVQKSLPKWILWCHSVSGT